MAAGRSDRCGLGFRTAAYKRLDSLGPAPSAGPASSLYIILKMAFDISPTLRQD